MSSAEPPPARRTRRSKPDWVRTLGRPAVQHAACIVWFVTLAAGLALTWRADATGLHPAISPLADGLIVFVCLLIAGGLGIVLSVPYQTAGEPPSWLGRLLVARAEWGGDYGPSLTRFISAATIAFGVGTLILTVSDRDLVAVAVGAVVGLGVWVWSWIALSEWDED